MTTVNRTGGARRRFLRLLAGSAALPLLQLAPGLRQALAGEIDPIGLSPAVRKSLEEYDNAIASADMAVDVFDLEAVAQRNLHVGHNAYLSGVEDQATLRANREGMKRYELRPRRLVDVNNIDMSIDLFGRKYATPLILCPVGHQRAFNLEAEVPVARAAKARNQLMALSTGADCTVEEVVAARGAPVLFQLYSNADWSRTRAMIKRAEAAGSTVMAFTVDARGGYDRQILTKVRRQNAQFCHQCHVPNPSDHDRAGENSTALSDRTFGDDKAPMLTTAPLGPPAIEKGALTWDYVKRIKDTTSMKLLIKGISAREDGELAMEHGADGVWLSNHGGRVENSGRSTIECIPEMVAGVAGRGPVIVDSGFRRGSDVFKALALGATAVGIGRPYIWGLAAFGQEGVETAIKLMTSELQLTMRQFGAANTRAINGSFVVDRARY